jgi:hypothetical protein
MCVETHPDVSPNTSLDVSQRCEEPRKVDMQGETYTAGSMEMLFLSVLIYIT